MNLKTILAGLLLVPVLAGCGSTSKTTDTLESIQSKGYITVATEGTYSPFSYHNDKDQLVGYDVEVARAIAKKLGVKAKFVETKWDGIVAGLDAKKYDVIINQVGVTPERQKKYLYAEPYTYSYATIITRKDNNSIKSFSDLKGKKSSQTTNSNWADIVRKNGGEAVGTEGFNQSIELVLQGRVDATVNDSVAYLDYKNNKPDADVKIAAQGDDVLKSAPLIRKSDKTLQKAITKAIKELKSEGKLKEISSKYFKEDVSQPK